MDILVLSVATGGCVGVLKITPQESAIYDPIKGRKMAILAGTLYDEELVIPQKTTSERMGYVPKDGAIVYDTTVQRIFVGDGETAGGVVPFTELHAAKVEVDSLVSGQIVIANCEPIPTALKTSGGKFYHLEKESLTQSGGNWHIDPAPYMAYANESAFAGPWTVYLAGGGAPGRKGDKGDDGTLTVPIQEYSSDSAYSALTCIAYNGGGYQVISGTSAGENPDNAPSKFLCFASSGAVGSSGTNGSNGISPTLTVSETGSGIQIVTSDAQGASSGFVSKGLPGSDGITPVISGGSVTTLPAGSSATAEIVLSGGSTYVLNFGIPRGPKGDNGSLTVPIQEYSSGSAYNALTCITYNGGGYQVISGTTAGENPDNAPGKFRCFASAKADVQKISDTGATVAYQGHEVFRHVLSSGDVIAVNSAGLSSAYCVTAELWLDMPSTPVSFTLPGFTWVDGAAPNFTSGSTRYAVTVRWDGSEFLANLAYSRGLA